MTYMTLNDVPLSARLRGGINSDRPNVSQKESVLGYRHVAQSRYFREFNFRTTPTTLEVAKGIDGFISGLGDDVRFDTHPQGSQGLRCSWSASSVSIVTNGYASGINSLEVISTSLTQWNPRRVYQELYSRQWTLSYLFKPSGGSWKHYLLRDDGVKFEDGVRNDALVPPASLTFSPTSSLLWIHNAIGDSMAALSLLPYRWPIEWGAIPFARLTGGSPWELTPRLRLRGDVLRDIALHNDGAVVTGITGSILHPVGAGDQTLREVDFSLRYYL